MKKRTKILLSICCAVIVLVSGGLAFAGNYFVTYALAADGAGGDRDAAISNGTAADQDEPSPTPSTVLPSWIDSNQIETLSITSEDNLTLQGRWYKQSNSHKWVIAVHGYHSNI